MCRWSNVSLSTLSVGFALTFAACSATPETDESNEVPQQASAVAPDVEDAFFAGSLRGANEVPATDEDGHALAFLSVHGNEVSFAIGLRGLAKVTAGHLHEGVKGTNGPIKIAFFTRPLPCGQTSVTGTVRVEDPQLLGDLRSGPGKFYFNLHTEAFPGGAVRAQVHALTGIIDMKRALRQNFVAPVLQGAQVYACTLQSDGTFAFTQDNVRATLEGGIEHFFAKPGPAGPPEWFAPDRSAVTGRVLRRTPNGDGNVAELDLQATQVGRPVGRLASIDEILRLNTVGGVAPAGPCDPNTQPTVAVPYQADYVFVDAIKPL